MPILYHYTCRKNIVEIFDTGLLRKGAVAINEFDVDKYKAVNLTTDTSPVGHGLPDGREISLNEAKCFGWYIEKNGKKYCANHTRYRIEINLPDSEMLVPAKQFHSASPVVLEALEIAGYFPTNKNFTDAELLQGRRGLADGTFCGKSDTWWYYFAEIPVQTFSGVSVLNQFGEYVSMNSLDFSVLQQGNRQDRQNG